jgi:hypothetical protein
MKSTTTTDVTAGFKSATGHATWSTQLRNSSQTPRQHSLTLAKESVSYGWLPTVARSAKVGFRSKVH